MSKGPGHPEESRGLASRAPDLAILVPAFNEAESLPALIRELRTHFAPEQIAVINDFSADATARIAREHGVVVLDLPVNLGIGGALQTGYRWALERGFEFAVQVDGDGQHDPASLAAMRATAQETQADMVIGSRFVSATDGFRSTWMRRFGIRWLSAVIRASTGQRIHDPTSGLRMVRRNLFREFARHYPHDYPEPESLTHALSAGLVVREVPVVMRPRGGGRSSIRLWGSAYYMVKVSLAIVLSSRLGRTEKGTYGHA